MFVSHNMATIKCKLPKIPLMSGTYECYLFSRVNNDIADWIENAFQVFVEEGDFFKSGKLPNKKENIFLIEQEWEVN
jgi:lipopolysaccharide transport system ATP-binding protein